MEETKIAADIVFSVDASLINLLALAGVAAAINLAYINLPSTRFRSLISAYIRDKFLTVSDPAKDQAAIKSIPLKKNYRELASYCNLFSMGMLQHNDFRIPYFSKYNYILGRPNLENLLPNDRKYVEKYSGFHRHRSFHKLFSPPGRSKDFDTEIRYAKSPDQVLSATFFIVSVCAVVLICGLSVDIGRIALVFWLIFLVFAFVYVLFFVRLSFFFKLVPISLCLLFVSLLTYELTPLNWDVLGPITQEFLAKTVFYLLLACIVVPVGFVLAAHWTLPRIFGDINSWFEDIVDEDDNPFALDDREAGLSSSGTRASNGADRRGDPHPGEDRLE